MLPRSSLQAELSDYRDDDLVAVAIEAAPRFLQTLTDVDLFCVQCGVALRKSRGVSMGAVVCGQREGDCRELRAFDNKRAASDCLSSVEPDYYGFQALADGEVAARSFGERR